MVKSSHILARKIYESYKTYTKVRGSLEEIGSTLQAVPLKQDSTKFSGKPETFSIKSDWQLFRSLLKMLFVLN